MGESDLLFALAIWSHEIRHLRLREVPVRAVSPLSFATVSRSRGISKANGGDAVIGSGASASTFRFSR
jgi:hypothetical protein